MKNMTKLSIKSEKALTNHEKRIGERLESLKSLANSLEEVGLGKASKTVRSRIDNITYDLKLLRTELEQ